jgi:hypothetical protein
MKPILALLVSAVFLVGLLGSFGEERPMRIGPVVLRERVREVYRNEAWLVVYKDSIRWTIRRGPIERLFINGQEMK